MPFVLNGVGTWYYGKRNVHRLRDVCSQCQAVTDLESYDTTLYFVVVFVPLIPLARKRIFDSCPSCNRHRVMPLGKWEAAKAKSIGEAALRLRESPGDREAVLNALRTAAGFQNVALAEEAGDVAAERFAGDAEVQSTLGDVSAYLARHDDAAAAYIASLDAADDPKVRDQLGLTMLRLGNVEAAAGCFEHVLTEADASRAWMLYQLAVAYQAKGMHGEALDLLDRADAAFPGLGDNKDWKKLRRASEKDRGRGRPVGRSTLLESKGAGVREGSRLGWLLPRLVLPLLLLGFAGWHTWRSLTLAQGRPVALVSGAPKPYFVTVGKRSFMLPPGTHQVVDLPEGTLGVQPDPDSGIAPSEVTFGSSFWARPYSGTRVVINPDRLAILVKEGNTYAEFPPPAPPDEYHSGKVLYDFSGIDYFFEPFPGTIKAKKGATITKTRLSALPMAGAESRVAALAEANVPPAERVEYGRRWLAADPDDTLALAWFAGTAPPADALAVLKGRLADRPLRVEWHRMYQAVAEGNGADPKELRAEYVKLADDLKRDPDALYLLARVSDRADAIKVLTEAVKSGKPAARAHYALGYRQLCEGDYEAAADSMDAAGVLAKTPAYRPVARDVLLAVGRTRQLLTDLTADSGLSAALERARVSEIAGDTTRAEAAEAQAMAMIPPGVDANLRRLVQGSLDAERAAARGDAAAYKEAVQAAGSSTAAHAVLRGEVPVAGAADAQGIEKATVVRGLIVLATPATDAAKSAAAKKAFLDALAAGGRDERELKEALVAGGPEVVTAVREANILPADKRVYAAVAARWVPAEAAKLTGMSRKFDFQRDAISLALRKLTGGKK